MPRLRLIVAALLMAIGVVGVAAVAPTTVVAQDCEPTLLNPCPDETTSTTSTIATTTTTIATTTTEAPTTTEATTTTEAPTTTSPPVTSDASDDEDDDTDTTEAPATAPTTAPPELAPQAPTTTAAVGELARVTQDTPDMTGMLMFWGLGLMGTVGVLGAGYVTNRRT